MEKVPRNEEKNQKIHIAGPNIREFFGTRAELAREGIEEMERDKIAPSILVTIFLVPTLARTNTSGSHALDGSVGTQTIHVDTLRGMVSIQDNNLLSEWNGIVDYKNALLAAKLFSKMACVLAKMDPAAFPSLDDMTQAMGKQASGDYPPTRGLTYTVLPNRIKNLAQYGAPVKDLCRAVPAYFAQQQKEGYRPGDGPRLLL
ncbi:Gastrokine-3 [Apodemus speciosus]|uniref:Gastrokine-3 n=1 Tax=Apodemus speciosus TaxID=105296 RepID=A0ABQ0EVV8_APOSI